MNQVSLGTHLAGVGLGTGAGALAACALAVPFGPGVGALAAMCGYMAALPVHVLRERKCSESLGCKIVAVVSHLFLSAGVTVGIAKAFGATIVFGGALAFSSVVFALTTAIAFLAFALIAGGQLLAKRADYHPKWI